MKQYSLHTFLVFTLLLITACGQEAKTDFDNSSLAIQGKSLICSEATGLNISAKQKAFRDSTTNSLNLNYTLLRLTSVPLSFSSSGAITFSTWKVSAANTKSDEKAVSFNIHIDGIGYAYNSFVSEISYAQLSAIAAGRQMTVDTLLNKSAIVVYLDDKTGEFEGLTIKHSASNTSLDMLLLPVKLSPIDYAVDSDGVSARPELLQSLHPMAAFRNETIEQLTARADKFCF